MDFRSRAMVNSLVEWLAAGGNTNGNIFAGANGVQSQALSLTTYSSGGQHNNHSDNGNNSDSTIHKIKKESQMGKTLSVRCIVESVSSSQFWDPSQSSAPNGHVELKRTVDVPTHTVMYNLVDEVLQKFGYPKEIALTARGSILIENWKPLRLEKVPVNSHKTVNDVFGQMSSVVTLKIQVLKPAVFSRVKDKLLQLLIQQNRDLMLNSGCPLDQITLKRIFDGSDCHSSLLSEDMIVKFEQWLNQTRQDIRQMQPFPSPLTQFPYHLTPSGPFSYDNKAMSAGTDDKVHPAMQTIQSLPHQKPRMRTSFDPELELPRLHKWFTENQHPTRQQIVQYVSELNNLESRKGRKPLDVNNVVYWFKNARAAQKRAETRSINSGQLGSVNGYRSTSHSPCDTAANSKESLGSLQSCDEDDMEDDDNRSETDEREDARSLDVQAAGSPIAPLSLTTTHRNTNGSRNSSPVPPQIKQEPPDKETEAEKSASNGNSPRAKDAEGGHSPVAEAAEVESESDDEMTEEDEEEDEEEEEGEGEGGSDADSSHRSSGALLDADYGRPHSPSYFANSSHLSLMSRAAGHPAPFPLVPNHSMFGSPYQFFGVTPYLSSVAMSHGVGAAAAGRNAAHPTAAPASGNRSPGGSGGGDERRNKRNRTFIDPVTEVPRLEKWYKENSHPSQGQILGYTENLNTLPYRSKFPKLEHKNVQFWFKNRRAKEKRLKTSLFEGLSINNNININPQEHYHSMAVAMNADSYRND